MRKWLGLLLFPLVAQAAGEGSWQASSIGVTLSNRGVAMSSRPLAPSEPVSGQMSGGVELFADWPDACRAAGASMLPEPLHGNRRRERYYPGV